MMNTISTDLKKGLKSIDDKLERIAVALERLAEDELKERDARMYKPVDRDGRRINGDLLRDLREMKDLSQRRMSDLTGISQQMLSALENGRVNPSSRTLRTLAQLQKQRGGGEYEQDQ